VAQAVVVQHKTQQQQPEEQEPQAKEIEVETGPVVLHGVTHRQAAAAQVPKASTEVVHLQMARQVAQEHHHPSRVLPLREQGAVVVPGAPIVELLTAV
jgi:hypothetical protein